MSWKDKLIKERMPKHVAVIMDGNGRWAKKRGNQRIFGHRNGVQSVRETVRAAGELEIDYLTLYAFSTENWNRPKKEIDALMSLLITSIEKETPELIKNNVRLVTIGDQSLISEKVKTKLDGLIAKTKENTGLTVVLALSYSARWEITMAMQQIAKSIESGDLKPEEVTEQTITTTLSTAKIPDPDLLIRTSGEHRISNFLLWQIAYAELYFTETLWPDFRAENFYEAIYAYQQRERRFGKTSEQIL